MRTARANLITSENGTTRPKSDRHGALRGRALRSAVEPCPGPAKVVDDLLHKTQQNLVPVRKTCFLPRKRQTPPRTPRPLLPPPPPPRPRHSEKARPARFLTKGLHERLKRQCWCTIRAMASTMPSKTVRAVSMTR